MTNRLPNIIIMLLSKQKGEHQRIGTSLAISIRDNKGFESNQPTKEAFCKENNCSLNTFYYVLNILRDANFIKKDGRKWILNLDFVSGVLKERNEFLSNKRLPGWQW